MFGIDPLKRFSILHVLKPKLKLSLWAMIAGKDKPTNQSKLKTTHVASTKHGKTTAVSK